MATSPPASPGPGAQRPLSTIARPTHRSSSRLSMSGIKTAVAGGSRASDEDSRTAVKVAVRVRPALKPSDPGYDLIPQRFQRSMVQTTSDTSLSIDSPQGRKLFVFDRVFASDVSQDGIWDYLNDSVNAFVQGYNVSLLAYGQSGAGKSYTMGTSGPGEQEDPEAMGVIPRAGAALFEKLDTPKSSSSIPSKSNRNSLSSLRTPRAFGQQNALGDRDWSLKATYVEIYNEHLRDLLVSDTTPGAERSNVAIREDTKGNIILTGLRTVDINSVDDLMSALSFGSSIRQTDATAINAKSSRSHAVFSLNLIQRKNKTASGLEKRLSAPLEAISGADSIVTTDSKLHFVDLAGSERLKNTGAQGERAKEGISINAGLASLGKVISQLSSRQQGSHVSYRDSKLTRLLQDSLGGNAITYMIACVTPAEFHLSETLNTVQYAQRARAIQSKPRIQQVEEGDKSAIIERLKAEVAFLREQIRSSADRGNLSPRAPSGTGDRSERANEREVELQNQLLDTQENYATLSQRHAKLIAELAKARETESEKQQEQPGDDTLTESADDRLNRSNSFAQAVEQVVLEYEKTIQSLEHSLSSTRGTLSSTETNLLEKETKCAYVETINTQLQARLQKLMDREANTETYLHDLEAKLDGHTNGEEKNATIIMELRKEITRLRENEASCEDYISTLEERLAESDQDQELMQREIDRMEQVIERQRSLGKLDSLLHDLDNVEEAKPPEPEPKLTNGASHRRSIAAHSREHSRAQSMQLEAPIPEGVEPQEADSKITTVKEEPEEVAQDDEAKETPQADGPEDVPPVAEPEESRQGDEPEEITQGDGIVAEEANGQENDTAETESQYSEKAVSEKPLSKAIEHSELTPPSPAQTRFVADKLESVTNELIGLRVEHESTVNEYDTLNSKYEDALRHLAEMQDALDVALHASRNENRDSILSETTNSRTRPQSFLSDTRLSDLKDGPRSSHSQSLSSELSSAMESPATAGTSNGEGSSDDETATTKPAASSEDLKEANSEQLNAELQRFKELANQKEAAEKELVERYAQLELKHNETLDVVEVLKSEVSRAKAVEATASRQSSPVIRRKSSQNLLSSDRANRSFVALRNIANDNLEGNIEVMQSFDINVNAAMHELQSRSERISELESALAASKKEMETKMTIISGLTRERTSLSASPRDISMVTNLQEQLAQNEKQLNTLREAHLSREQELTSELESLRQSLNESGPSPMVNGSSQEHEAKVAELQSELAHWEEKHKAALETMQSTEKEMRNNIQELEAEVASVNSQLTAARQGGNGSPESKELEEKHSNSLDYLRNEIDEYKAVINSNAAKVAELEHNHSTVKTELEDMTRAHATAHEEATRHKELVGKLEEQISAHEQATKTHQESLDLLKETHDKELSALKSQEQQGYQEQVEVLMSEHAESIQKLENDVQEARDDLMSVATQVAFALGVDVSIEKLTERIDTLVADQKTLAEQTHKVGEMEAQVSELSKVNETITKDLESARDALSELLAENQDSVPTSFADQVATVKNKMSELEIRSKKNSRLVEELEEQLQNNFDEAQLTNNRLSTLQTERHAQLEEALNSRQRMQAELDTVKEEYNALQSKYDEAMGGNGNVQRSDSNSTIRKSASHASLPSPPPSVPLPPLPAPGHTSPGPGSPVAGRPGSKDAVNMNISQITEDQENRIRTIEKHLYAERQLTQTLEEALGDLEQQSNKVKADCEGWKKRANELEIEVKELRDRPTPMQDDNRWSVHAVEEERKKRQAAEAARKQLEERMNAINKGKKKKGSLNCF